MPPLQKTKNEKNTVTRERTSYSRSKRTEDILPEFSLPLGLSMVLTSALIFLRIEFDASTSWLYTFLPVQVFLLYQSILLMWGITQGQLLISKGEEEVMRTLSEKSIPFAKMVIYCGLFGFFAFLIDYLDSLDQSIVLEEKSLTPAFISLFISLLTYTVFSISLKVQRAQADRETLPTSIHSTDPNAPRSVSKALALVSSFIHSMVTVFFSFFVFCNGGMCYTIYISNLTSFFGVFGVSVIDLSDLMKPLTVLFVSISLISLFARERKILYPPFLLGVVGAILVLVNEFLEIHRGMMYAGNGMLIGGAIWNSRRHSILGN